MTWKPTLGLFLRVAAGLILAYAGFYKAVGPSAEFAATIMNYHVVPSWVASGVAYVLPWVELYIGTALLLGFALRWTLKIAAGLFGMFLVVLLSAMIRGIDLSSCGCFGTAILLPPPVTITLDAVLGTAMLFLTRLGPVPLSLDSWISAGKP